MKDKFIEFLRSKRTPNSKYNAWGAFVMNWKASYAGCGVFFQDWFNEYFARNQQINPINEAFSWSSTAEGYDFWKTLYKEWEEFLKKKDENKN